MEELGKRQGEISRGPKKSVFVDSKGNVKQFLAPVLPFSGRVLDGVWDFSHLRLPLVFCCSRRSRLSEALFQGQISRGPKDCFCGFQR